MRDRPTKSLASIETDGALSIDTGLERAVVVGPVRRSCVMHNLLENKRNKVIRRGSVGRLSDPQVSHFSKERRT